MDFLLDVLKILGGCALAAWLLLWFMGKFEDDDWTGVA